MRLYLFVVLAALISFGASINGSFHLDDYSIFSNPVLTSGSGWWEVWRPSQTRPLTYFTFWLNYQLGGTNPIGYHLVNLLLHLACVILAGDTLPRLMPKRAAWIGTAVFAVHPIQTEAVDYVFARSSVLMTLFCLIALRSWATGRHWVAVVWFAVGLVAKEECVAFPVFLFLLWLSISRNRREWAPIGAMLGLAVLAGIRVLYATGADPGAGAGFASPVKPLEYFAAQGTAILRYLQLLVFPVGFSADPEINARWWAWLLLAVLAAAALKRFAGAREGFWFLGGLVLLVPSSSFLPAMDLSADRRMYLPMVAFSAMIGLLLARFKTYVPVGAVVILTAFSVARTQVWQTEELLWSEAVEKAPNKIRPRIHLARAVEPARAVLILTEAKKIAPDDFAVASELGTSHLSSGRPDLALSEFGRVLAGRPRDASALNNRGAALLALEQADWARADFERAIQLNPCLIDPYINLKRIGVRISPPDRCRFPEEQHKLLTQ